MSLKYQVSRCTGCLAIIAVLFSVSCSQLPAIEDRVRFANDVAVKTGFSRKEIATRNFTLLAYNKHRGIDRNSPGSNTLRVYIEGDGLAFLNRYTPSGDPTPVDPLALRLAMQDNANNVAYIARPCQFLFELNKKRCTQQFWTSARFSEPVIASIDQAIDVLKKEAAVDAVELIGYSGGGAVVALLALRREDVTRIVTVAGNIDHAYWTKDHLYTPLKHSLNAADFPEALSTVRQVHMVGGKDTNITRGVLESYLSKMPQTDNVSVIDIADFDHSCCWVKRWPELLQGLKE